MRRGPSHPSSSPSYTLRLQKVALSPAKVLPIQPSIAYDNTEIVSNCDATKRRRAPPGDYLGDPSSRPTRLCVRAPQRDGLRVKNRPVTAVAARHRGDRRRPRQAGSRRLEFRGRNAAVEGRMARWPQAHATADERGAHASARRPKTAKSSAGSLQIVARRQPDRRARRAKPATSNFRQVSVWMDSFCAKAKLRPATETT
jgi:hypothetical protein